MKWMRELSRVVPAINGNDSELEERWMLCFCEYVRMSCHEDVVSLRTFCGGFFSVATSIIPHYC